jgi:hypothetical protein
MVQMIKISKHLFLKEVIKSNTASRLGIDNSPTEEHLVNLKKVANNIFEPLRSHFNVPIGISSGYRSEALNKAIGGSKTSQHCKGEALDIDADIFGKLANVDIFNYIKDNLDFDQLIWEYGNDINPAWVHCSYKSKGNRKQILKLK